jgi:excisionase family DNA binding protein
VVADERLLSVSQVADRLHVSRARVRQLVDRGALDSRRVGRQLVFDEDSLRAVIRERPAGRPVSPELAWGIALAAEGSKPDWLSSVQRFRAVKTVRESSPAAVRAKLARRAVIARYHASERGLGVISQREDSCPAGSSLAGEHEIDLLVPGVIERYVARSEMHDLVRLAPLLPNLAQPNVILHVMDDSLWGNIQTLDHIPPAAAASDLIEVGFLLDSDRWQRAGWDLLERSWPKNAG